MPRNYDVVKIDPDTAPDNNEVPPDVAATGQKTNYLPWVLSGVVLLAVIACVSGLFMASKSTAANSETPPTPTVSLTLEGYSQKPTGLPTLTATATETVTPTVTMTLTPHNIQYLMTPVAGQELVTMLGNFTPKSGCSLTNFGFDASDHEYYLSFESISSLPWLGMSNPSGMLAVVQGYTQTVSSCPLPFLSVVSVSWFNDRSELATATPRRYSGGSGSTAPTRTPTNTPFPTTEPYVPPQKVFPTYTVYPTYTAYPTFTPTPTGTPTIPPTPTNIPTDTPTPTLTFTPTFTPTPTQTPTLTPTITITPTLTPTLTPTITITPTLTPTVIVTVTATITPAGTITP